MGNIFSIQCGDALSGRCWDCITKRSRYIYQLEDNLAALEADKTRLSGLKDDVMRAIINQQRPHTEQPDQVTGWLSEVDRTTARVDLLITRGARERQDLCMAGRCSKHCVSTYKFGKSVARSLIRVSALISEGAEFQQVVVRAPARQLESDLQELRNAKANLQARKDDLQQRISSEEGPGMRTLEEVQVWLSKSQTLLAEADGLTENGPQELSRLLGGEFSNSMFVGRVAQHLEDIRTLHSQGDFSQVTAKAIPGRVVGRNQRPTVGNEEMLEEAWSLLHKVEVGIIGIYGMGGVGKTTLLKQINNNFTINPNDFDVVIWVVVSKDLKLDNIQELIWKRIRSMDDRWPQKSFEEKAQDIFDVLQRKKFVLLLDDVWQQFDLEEIGVPLPTQRNGSKVVLTTRSLAVCKEMEATQTMIVKPLNQEEAWQLFKEKVGNINADVLHVAEKIADECQGLPIAIITIGRAMSSRSTIEEWEHALKVLKRSVSEGMENEIYLGMELHVFKRLKFSYDCLSNDKVRNCFLCCSLFPEDFEIPTDVLVGYWVAEKFCDWGEGHWIVGTLIQQCLLEDVRKDAWQYVKMHDVIRDMALWIASKCEKEKHMFFVKAGAQLIRLPAVEEWEGAKRVSFMANSFMSIEGSPRCSDLLTLLLSHNRELKIISKGFFQFMTRLTVLDLSWSDLTVLPLEIMNLQSLEFLNLSFSLVRELPTEMKNLMRLKYLNIDSTPVKMIPVEVISNLLQLQVFVMCHNRSRDFEVENNVLSKDGDKLVKELMCLKNLSEVSLEVRSASFLHSICSNQQLLNSIRALRLCNFSDSKPFNILSLANAKTRTRGPGCSLNNNLPIFRVLREFFVSSCAIRHMTWLIFAPNLTVLSASDIENMEEIISAKKLSEYQARGQHFNLFPRLQILDLEIIPKLKIICPKALSFPCLTQIKVRYCPDLRKLPLNSESAEGCNVVIRGHWPWWRQLTWEDDETRAAFSSCFQEL